MRARSQRGPGSSLEVSTAEHDGAQREEDDGIEHRVPERARAVASEGDVRDLAEQDGPRRHVYVEAGEDPREDDAGGMYGLPKDPRRQVPERVGGASDEEH